MIPMKDNNDLILPKQSAKIAFEKRFPVLIQAYLNSAVARGYALAYSTIHDDDSAAKWISFGRGPFAVESRLKQIAVEVAICRLIENGDLPFDYFFKSNSRGNHKYLIVTDHDSFHMTVNQCSNDKHPAKKSQYRDKENTNFQTRLVLDKDDIINGSSENEYIELNHGYRSKEPMFVNLGIPQKGTNGWAYCLNISNSVEVKEFPKPKTKVEGPESVTPDEFAAYSKRESNE